MPLVLSFVAGFVAAQLTWWVAARGSLSPGDAVAVAGAPMFRYVMLAGAETLSSAIAFGIALMLAARSRLAPPSAKSVLLSFAVGALTATIAAGPFALIPRIVEGEAMLLIWIVAAVLVSIACGALVGAAFRDATPEEPAESPGS